MSKLIGIKPQANLEIKIKIAVWLGKHKKLIECNFYLNISFYMFSINVLHLTFIFLHFYTSNQCRVCVFVCVCIERVMDMSLSTYKFMCRSSFHIWIIYGDDRKCSSWSTYPKGVMKNHEFWKSFAHSSCGYKLNNFL